jgi:hypothetical protein
MSADRTNRSSPRRHAIRHLAPLGLCGLLALTLPLAAWAQSKPAAPLSDRIEQRLQQLGNNPLTFTSSEFAAFRARIADCWVVPKGVRDLPNNMRVTVQVKFATDGSLAEPPKVLNPIPIRCLPWQQRVRPRR